MQIKEKERLGEDEREGKSMIKIQGREGEEGFLSFKHFSPLNSLLFSSLLSRSSHLWPLYHRHDCRNDRPECFNGVEDQEKRERGRRRRETEREEEEEERGRWKQRGKRKKERQRGGETGGGGRGGE